VKLPAKISDFSSSAQEPSGTRNRNSSTPKTPPYNKKGLDKKFCILNGLSLNEQDTRTLVGFSSK
jgi:hypothetical protein